MISQKACPRIVETINSEILFKVTTNMHDNYYISSPSMVPFLHETRGVTNVFMFSGNAVEAFSYEN